RPFIGPSRVHPNALLQRPRVESEPGGDGRPAHDDRPSRRAGRGGLRPGQQEGHRRRGGNSRVPVRRDGPRGRVGDLHLPVPRSGRRGHGQGRRRARISRRRECPHGVVGGWAAQAHALVVVLLPNGRPGHPQPGDRGEGEVLLRGSGRRVRPVRARAPGEAPPRPPGAARDARMTATPLLGSPLPDGVAIGVPALSTPYFYLSDVSRGVEWWEAQGYRIKLADGIWARDDYVAGDPEARARDVEAMFADPEVDVVQCLQGGFGAAQLLPYLDFDVMASNPKALCGFSDITALHVAIRQRTGL